MTPHTLTDDTLVRANDLVGPNQYNPEKHGPRLLPFGRSKFFADIRAGKIPEGIKLGSRTTAYRWGDIREAYGLPAVAQAEG